MSEQVVDGLLAAVVRNGFAESYHRGIVSVVDAEKETATVGDTSATIFARSALKPFQLIGMLQCGLGQMQWTPAELAVMASSHSGQAMHRKLVQEILGKVGLSEKDLKNTAAWPMDPLARHELREAGVTDKASLFADCSGKHSAMLATCVINGWSTVDYLDSAHPLQQQVKVAVADMTGDTIEHVAVDGCGAPLFSGTTTGLARGYARLVTARPGSAAHDVASAMQAHPELVAGRGRDVTAAMQCTPGLLVKDGAEGVLAAGFSDPDRRGLGIAIKVSDGAARPRPAVLAAVLRALDVPMDRQEWAEIPVLGGGRVVGEIQSSLMLMWKPK